MKKALSLVLSFVMLLSVVAGMNITAFADIEIEEVDIYNITEPVAGKAPDFDYQQYDFASENVEKNAKTQASIINGIAWYDVTNKKYLSESSKFKCANTYRVEIYIKAASGAFFSGYGVTGTINEKGAAFFADEDEAEGEGLICTAEFVTPNHKWTVDEDWQRATLGKDGKKTYTCSKCGATKSTKISKISSISLSPSSYTYDGKVKSPKIVVKNSAGTVLKEDYYMYGFDDGRKNVGTYSCEIILKGNYAGIFAREFKINPKGTALSSLSTPKKGNLKASWAKQTTQTTGYQIKYSTSKNFTSSKTVTVSSNKTTSKTITGLKSGKTYYVRVRTYKTKDGTKYYSSWSSYKYKKVK